MLTLASEPFVSVAEVRADRRFVAACYDVTDVQLAAAIDEASDLLVRWTHGQFRGRAARTVYPRYDRVACVWDPFTYDAAKYRIELNGETPTITSVLLDGVDPGNWVADASGLVRTGGYQWPLNANELGGPVLAVAVTSGGTVGFITKMAAIELVMFLLKDLIGVSSSGMPMGVKATTIDGSRVEADEDADGMSLPAVQRFIAIYGHGHATVWSPELAPAWRT